MTIEIEHEDKIISTIIRLTSKGKVLSHDAIELSLCNNLQDLEKWYTNRDLVSDLDKCKALITTMGILHSTEPNTLLDLEELVLTHLWEGLN